MRSRVLRSRALLFGASQRDIAACVEKDDLISLHDRCERTHCIQQVNRVRQTLHLRQAHSTGDGSELLKARSDNVCPCPSPQGIRIDVLWNCADSLSIILQHLSDKHARMLCTFSKELLVRLDSAGIICPAAVRPSNRYLRHQGLQKVALAAHRCMFAHLDLSLVRGQQAWQLVVQAVLPHCHMLRELSVSTEILCVRHRSEDLSTCTGLPLVTTLRLRDDALFAPHEPLRNDVCFEGPPNGISLPPGRRRSARPPFHELEAELLHIIGMMPNLCVLDLTRTILGPDQLRRIIIGWHARHYTLELDGCFMHLLGGSGHETDTNTTSQAVSDFLVQIQRRLRWLPWSSLNTLSLAGNSLGDRGITHFHTHLQTARNLKSLNLSYNYVTDSGANVLACNFRFLQSLESLNLSGNRLTTKGAEYVCTGAQMLDGLCLLDITRNHVHLEKLHELITTWNQARSVVPSRNLRVYYKGLHRAACTAGGVQLYVQEQVEPWS